MPSRKGIRLVEGSLFAVAFLCVLYLMVTFGQARAARRVALSMGTVSAAEEPHGGTSAGAQDVISQGAGTGDGKVIGRLEIPGLRLTVPILSNYDPESLKRGVGHIPGTAFPGGLGTVGLAGHRDMFLRPLKDIRKGMDIRLVGEGGTYHYTVDSTEIVKPTEVRVLDIGERPELTLITCYPFYFVGSAPERFIVHAHLLSVQAD
jgi:sortase A